MSATASTGAGGIPRIRPARVEDASAIAAGEYAVARTPGLLNARPGEIPERAFRDKVAALADSRRGLYLVAESDSGIVGHLLLDPLPLAGHAHVCILTIVVYPGWQGRGVGRALLEQALAWVRAHPNVSRVELTVRADNARAIALYRALGFREEGRLRNRVTGSDGVCRDDLAMALLSSD